MKGDVSRSAPGGSSMSPWSLSYPRWPIASARRRAGGLNAPPGMMVFALQAPRVRPKRGDRRPIPGRRTRMR